MTWKDTNIEHAASGFGICTVELPPNFGLVFPSYNPFISFLESGYLIFAFVY